MSLSVALKVAQSALAARQTESSVVSRNIAGAQDPGYSRKSVLLSQTYTDTGQAGGLKVDGIGRVTDSALYSSLLSSTSTGSSQEAVLAGLTRLAETTGDTQNHMSAAAKLGALKLSLQNYASDPATRSRRRTFCRPPRTWCRRSSPDGTGAGCAHQRGCGHGDLRA